jgi:elongation factor G
MGELHLEILTNRMEREFNVHARVGRPRVAYRETVVEAGSGVGEFDRKMGDAQVWCRAVVDVAPRPRPLGVRGWSPVEIASTPATAGLPPPLQQAARRVLADVCSAGGPHGYPVVDVTIAIEKLQVSDAPDLSVPLIAALTTALRRAFAATRTVLLEPVMRLEARAPEEFVGNVVRDLSTRRAEIRETALQGRFAVVRAQVPLTAMFGYSTQLRSLTQGRGNFVMEPFDYQPVPDTVSDPQGTVA